MSPPSLVIPVLPWSYVTLLLYYIPAVFVLWSPFKSKLVWSYLIILGDVLYPIILYMSDEDYPRLFYSAARAYCARFMKTCRAIYSRSIYSRSIYSI